MTELTHSKLEANNYINKLELVIFIVFGLSCIAVLSHRLLDMVVVSGNHFSPYPGEDLVSDYVFGIIWAAALGISILFWPVPSREKRALIWIWLIKVVIALVFMLVYEYRYAFDPDGYFHNAIAPDFMWKNFHFGNGTYTTQQLTWLCLKIVPGSYHATKISFTMVGLVGIYVIYRSTVIFLQHEDIRILFIIALFPSIVFWSSVLGKDPITLLGFSFYVYGVIAWHCLRQPRYLIPLVLGILIVSLIRIWVATLMVAPLLVFVTIGKHSFIWRMTLIVMCALLFMLVLPKIQNMWNISIAQDLYRFRAYAVGASLGGGSTEKAPEITGLRDSIRFLPFGIFTALFRPLPLEIRNLFGFFQGIENLVLILLLVVAVKRTKLKELKEPLVLWAILLILAWAALYGLVIFNLGAMVRYKLQILPVFLGLLLYLSRRRTRIKISAKLC